MKRSTILFLVAAAAAAIVCVRLGFWQLDRRQERRASNRVIAARSLTPAVPVTTLSGDTAELRFRLGVVAGQPDYDREIILSHRGNNGAPGLDIVTPVLLAGSDSAVLVNRGWVYSPDGMTTDLIHWRERDTVFTGYIDTFQSTGDSLRGRTIRSMDYDAIARTLPYPIRRFYVVAMGDTVGRADSVTGKPNIVRLRPPKLGEGPHLSYAFQWFGFATIALVGAGIVTARSMQSRSS